MNLENNSKERRPRAFRAGSADAGGIELADSEGSATADDDGRSRALQLRAKGAGEQASASDGKRILIDRLWPHERTWSDLLLSEWYPEWAPSAELEQWFDLRPERWEEYCKAYRAELEGRKRVFGQLLRVRLIAEREPVTLVASGASQNLGAGKALVRIIHELEP